MNVNMWNHPATRENLDRLRGHGVHVVDPDEGYLACGMTGAGRLAGQEAIVAAVREVLRIRRDLEGQTVLLTAGPTQEAIDPVRYLSNRSSGRMTHHKYRNRLECHYCGYTQSIPKKCPKCDSQYVYFFGEGSEQLEERLRKEFPRARIARLDRDTARTKRQYQETLGAFAEGALDILVGTQMLAKGHDFHRVTLVGVVGADSSLNMPFFSDSKTVSTACSAFTRLMLAPSSFASTAFTMSSLIKRSSANRSCRFLAPPPQISRCYRDIRTVPYLSEFRWQMLEAPCQVVKTWWLVYTDCSSRNTQLVFVVRFANSNMKLHSHSRL